MEPVLDILKTIILPLLGMLALVIVGWFIASMLRAWSKGGEDASAEGFTLDELRRLKREGAITDEQYARATEKVVSSAKTTLKPKAPGTSSTKPVSPVDRWRSDSASGGSESPSSSDASEN